MATQTTTTTALANDNKDDVYGAKFDRCAARAVTYTAVGVGFGALFSVVLFKRRPWPIAGGGGFGLGMAYSDCQHAFSRD
eukprot:m.16000 g.16000  ORF g.16000 m.16000 type:complete len:80 (-) comp5557_c0_seq1:175-414(-)